MEENEIKEEKCGTLAYMAPEVMMKNYSGFSSDVS